MHSEGYFVAPEMALETYNRSHGHGDVALPALPDYQTNPYCLQRAEAFHSALLPGRAPFSRRHVEDIANEDVSITPAQRENEFRTAEAMFYNPVLPFFPNSALTQPMAQPETRFDGYSALLSSGSEKGVDDTILNQCNEKKNCRAPKWKPSEEQKRLLEQHFNSGYKKPTPELCSAVKKEGRATEKQITVWFKNKQQRQNIRSRVKQAENRRPSGTENSYAVRKSNPDYIEKPLENLKTVLSAVKEELEMILHHTDDLDITRLCKNIKHASKIVCYGIGKEGLIMSKFARNLCSAGYSASFLTDASTLPVGQNDLFILSSGPSYYSTIQNLGLESIRLGAAVALFTAHKTADAVFTDFIIRIPGQTSTPSLPYENEFWTPKSDYVSFLPDGRDSVMNMGSSFEIGLSIVHASILSMLRGMDSVHNQFQFDES